MDVDPSGYVYVGGYTSGDAVLHFGEGVYTSGGYSGLNALVVKYNAEGTAQWAKATSESESNSLYNAVVAVDTGNLYGVGYMEGTSGYNFGSGLVYGSSGGYNGVIVQYNKNGACQWARSVSTGIQHCNFYDVARDSSGNLYVAGYIGSGDFDFAGRSAAVRITGRNATNCCLLKTDSDGYALWGKTTSAGPRPTSYKSVHVDSAGNAFCFGYLTGTVATYFDSVSAEGVSSSNNLLVVKYSPSGTALSAKAPLLGGGGSELNGGCVDRSGNPVGAGYLNGITTFSFGGDVTVAASYSGKNALLVKYLGRE